MAARDIPDGKKKAAVQWLNNRLIHYFLPEINIHRLINSHIVEIHSLKRQCKTKACKQTLQRIPRHMRRRAASNNPKRMPKALQQQHGGNSFNAGGNQQTSKKKKAAGGAGDQNGPRKKKKKSKSEHVKRRNANPLRTPLHLWFAKRFKLHLSWGQLMPLKNNVKNQRTLYRCSKAGYSLFYLPFRCSYLLERSGERKEVALDYLAHFLSPEDGAKLRELVTGSEGKGQTITVDLYAPCRWPVELIGPLQITYFKEEEEEDKFYLLVNAHVQIKEAVSNLFSTTAATDENSSQQQQLIESLPGFGELRLVDPSFQLHHIRLFGRKAAHRLGQLFFPTKRNLLDDLPLNQVAILQTGASSPDHQKEACTVPLRQLHQHTAALLLLPSKSSSKSSSPPPPPITFAVHRRQLNMSSGGAGAAHRGAPVELLELAVPLVHLKAVWNRLTANMSHLVGGHRDLEVLALETRSTFFPSVGYADHHHHHHHSEQDEKPVDLPKLDFLSADQFYVVRQANLESAAAAALSPSSSNFKDALQKAQLEKDSRTATVYVTVEYVKGRPGGGRNEALIYPPDAASLEAYLRAKSEKDGERVKVMAAEGDEEAIGFVEFGCFSLDAARCRATALLKVAALEQLKSSQQALVERLGLEKSKQPCPLYAVVKSPKSFNNNLSNLVTVAVMNVKDNWL